MGVLVVLLAILVARSWDPDQALGYNVATLVAPLIASLPNWSWEAIAMLPHDEQIKVLNTMIGQQDDAFASEQTVRMIFSSAVAEASFGPNATLLRHNLLREPAQVDAVACFFGMRLYQIPIHGLFLCGIQIIFFVTLFHFTQIGMRVVLGHGYRGWHRPIEYTQKSPQPYEDHLCGTVLVFLFVHIYLSRF